ncbi:MAG: hypothetical protein GY833_23035 [Aestuariibacter sp.]|nr:hypothetical protein [Aestuariibacter sp.]|tara:strand:- start:177825 stop:178310 length:486 start_codon:yes stop_codon:yes gene_type:complete
MTLTQPEHAKWMSFSGIECDATRVISADFRMITMCKPYLDKYDAAQEDFNRIDTSSEDVTERYVEALKRLETAWCQIAASWALATQEINPNLHRELRTIMRDHPMDYLPKIREHINDAMAYLCTEQGVLRDEQQIRRAIELQREYIKTEREAFDNYLEQGN